MMIGSMRIRAVVRASFYLSTERAALNFYVLYNIQYTNAQYITFMGAFTKKLQCTM